MTKTTETCLESPKPILDANSLVDRGKYFLSSGDALGAYAMFNYALNLGTDSAEVFALLASSCLGLGANCLADHYSAIALERAEGMYGEVSILARQVSNVSKVRRGLDSSPVDLDQLADNENERSILRGLSHIEHKEFEEGLYEIASAISSKEQDIKARNLFILSVQKFQSERERFEAFVDSLGLLADPGEPNAVECYERRAVIDIIIPVHGAIDELTDCIRSIKMWRSPLMGKIIIVDDASVEHDRCRLSDLASYESEITLVVNESNLGFTRSVMKGIKHSSAPYAVFLNSDTVVSAGWLDRLFFAISRRPRTALAGPLTNNGYYQTMDDTPEVKQALRNNIDRVAASVLAETECLTPVVPLLSGFCLLVRRDAFDEVGGLDEDSFPYGYWETQDLCLRLKDAGYNAVIADDTFVFHFGSKSIASEKKNRLIAEGRDVIHNRYSRLRFQMAEALCAIDPTIVNAKRQLVRLATLFGKAATNVNDSDRLHRPKSMIVKHGYDFSSADEICLFVAHAPFGRVPEFTKKYLRDLRQSGFRIVLCLATDVLRMPVDADLVKISEFVVVRENFGFDFGAWADMLRLFPAVWNCRRLLFVNDSMIGPLFSMAELVSSIRATDAGFFALTDCTIGPHHAQSFFFGWNASNLGHVALRSFWDEVSQEKEKSAVIDKCERKILALSDFLPDASRQILFGLERVFGVDPESVQGVSMSHHAWRAVVKAGMPFVKAQLFREEMLGWGVARVETGKDLFLIGLGLDADAIARHIEFTNINRMCGVDFLRREVVLNG